MKFRLVYVLLVLFLLASVSLADFNVWEPEDGVQIRQGYHIEWGTDAIASDENGNWCITWSDGHMGQHNVFAQLYDASGNPLWGNEPLVVAEGPWSQQNCQAIKGDGDSWIIIWDDYRDDVAKEALFVRYAQKIAENGSFLWADQGAPVYTNPTGQFYSKSISDGSGGLYHLWHDYPDGIRMQHINSNGNMIWGDEGILYESISGYFRVALSGSDLVLLSWHNSFGSNITINKFNADGEPQWGPDNEGFYYDRDHYMGTGPYMAVDENESVYFTWTESNTDDVVALVIDNDGNEISGGIRLIATNGNYVFENAAIILDENLFRVFYSSVDGNICFQDVTVADNDLSLAYSTTGNLAAEIDYLNCINSWSDGNGGSFLAYREYVNYRADEIFSLVHIDNSGTLSWSEPLDITSYSYPMVDIVTTDDEVIIIKQDDYEDHVGLYFDYLNAETGTMVNNNPEFFDHTIIEGYQFNTTSQQILKSGENVFTTWIDYRNPVRRIPYIQKNDFISGESEWAAAGIPLVNNLDSFAEYYSYDLKTIPDGENGLYAVFNNHYINEGQEEDLETIRIQRINENGDLLLGDHGSSIIEFDPSVYNYPNNPFIFLDSSGNICIFFENYDIETWAAQIFFQKVTSSGELLCGSSGIALTSGEDGDNNIIDIIQHNDEFHIFYENSSFNDASLFINSVNADGDFVWDDAVPLGNYTNTYSLTCNATKVGSYTVVAWLEYDQNPVEATYCGNVIDLDGNKLNGPDPVEIFDIYDYTYRLELIKSDNNSFWLGYIIDDNRELRLNRYDLNFNSLLENTFIIPVENVDDARIYEYLLIPDLESGVNVTWIEGGDVLCENDIFHHHITSEGNSADEAYGNFGLPVCNAWYGQEYINAVTDGEGGFLIAWNDYRGSSVRLEEDDVYIMRMNDFTTTVKSSGYNNIPVNWALLPAYPNPFNPATSIKYHVGENSRVKLTVYDILGRQVAQLVNKQQNAGEYSVIWNGHNGNNVAVSSGTYFYRLEAKDVNISRSMILLK